MRIAISIRFGRDENIFEIINELWSVNNINNGLPMGSIGSFFLDYREKKV